MQLRYVFGVVLGFLIVLPGSSLLGKPKDDEKQVAQLVKQLKSKDAKERAEAAHELIGLGEKAKPAMAALVELNKDKDWSARRNAILALGAIGKESEAKSQEVATIVKHFFEVLKDTKSADNDEFAVCVATVSELKDLVDDKESPHVKNAVAAGLPLLKHKGPRVREEAAALMEDCKEQAKAAVPTLVMMLKDPNEGVKRAASRALLEIDPETAKKHGIE